MASIESTTSGGVTVLRLKGSLTIDQLAGIEGDFQRATHQRGAAVLVDLSNVDMLTTPAISMFLAAAKDLKQLGGKIFVTGPQPRVGQILARLRLDHLLPVCDSIDDALQQLGRS